VSGREIALGPRRYAAAVARLLPHARPTSRRREERLLFVVGSPRSGTTFLAGALGRQPGCVDLGEVAPLKAAIPGLFGLAQDRQERRVRAILERVRLLSLTRGLRGVEQTPETSFLLAAALAAYPQARAVHIVRDGRDVVASLLERGWLSRDRAGGHDDARLPYGVQPRFWVEPERVEEFATASDATRAAWAWRRYVAAARTSPERTVELRYERLVSEPEAVAADVAGPLELLPGPLAAALGRAHDRSAGRWRERLTDDQVADVEREAGTLLRELGYAAA